MGDDDLDKEADATRGVSLLQDVLVTAVVALIGTAVAFGVYQNAGFGLVPSLCVGSGLFIWLLSAHFLITRMRLKKLIDQRLALLDNDVERLKKEAEITELLAEGHNELVSGQGALEKAVTLIAQRMDGYDQRLKTVYKLAKQGKREKSRGGDAGVPEVRVQFVEMQDELKTLGQQIKGIKSQFDERSALQFDLIRAELEVLEMVVRQVRSGSSQEHQSFCERALQVIEGLRRLPVMHQDGEVSALNTAKTVSGVSAATGEAALLSAALYKEGATASLLPDGRPSKDDAMVGKADAATSHAGSAVTGESGGDLTGASRHPQHEGKIENILAVVNEAIEADRIELFLQPVVKLPGREIVYYEALSRLRSDMGQLLLPKDYATTADKAGLTPIIENQIILMVIKVVQKLIVQGKAKRVFCPLSLASLRDADFFAEFMDFMEANGWLNEHLVFQFSLASLDQAGQFENERLKDIAKLGFAFALADVTRLDLDFRSLADRHFKFIKFGADLLLGDVLNARAEIHPADHGPYLERLNIQLVIDQVAREPIVRQLRDHNVHYTQGVLFCEPKPVRRDVFDSAARAKAGQENAA